MTDAKAIVVNSASSVKVSATYDSTAEFYRSEVLFSVGPVVEI